MIWLKKKLLEDALIVKTLPMVILFISVTTAAKECARHVLSQNARDVVEKFMAG